MKLDVLGQSLLLKKLVRELDKGDILFTEGSTADSVILVLEGSLSLSRKTQGGVAEIGKVGSGEFIGELALLNEQPFLRAATATASTPTTLLELGPQQFSQLETDSPKLFCLLLKKAFKTVVARHKRSEAINEILKDFDPRKRFLQYMHFLAQQGEKTSQGLIFKAEPAPLANQINCSPVEVEDWTQQLIELKLIIPKENGLFLTTDENLFLDFDLSNLEPARAA